MEGGENMFSTVSFRGYDCLLVSERGYQVILEWPMETQEK